MSELKVIKIELNNHGKPIASIQGTTSYYGISPNDTFYPKSEVDKVLAEKDKELRHSNHKRCLAMADMNWWQANRYSAAEMVERIRGNFEEATQCSKLEEKYLKRYNKWLALAEEPTWERFLQLIHKEDK